MTGLVLAMHADSKRCMHRRLLDAGAEVDAGTTAGSTACAVACTGGHTPVVRALIAAHCDVDLQVGRLLSLNMSA